MRTELKDVIHLYMGVECEHKMLKRNHKLSPMFLDGWNIEDYKPILRLRANMTDEEKAIYRSLQSTQLASPVHQLSVIVDTAESFAYLLKIGIDLFGLIESEQAINKN